MNSTIGSENHRSHPELDATLRDFFQAELPRPWPRWKMKGGTAANESSGAWQGSLGRWALAASIGILLAGYLGLSALFPSREGFGVAETTHIIGQKESRKKGRGLQERAMPTPIPHQKAP